MQVKSELCRKLFTESSQFSERENICVKMGQNSSLQPQSHTVTHRFHIALLTNANQPDALSSLVTSNVFAKVLLPFLQQTNCEKSAKINAFLCIGALDVIHFLQTHNKYVWKQAFIFLKNLLLI